ncbi:hypothetical protein ACHAPE_002804 [Trichoderma viride]
MVIPGSVSWDPFVIICPVFKEALPGYADSQDLDTDAKRYIADIRSSMKAILLVIAGGQLDNTKLENANISGSLYSLLEVFEYMISASFERDRVHIPMHTAEYYQVEGTFCVQHQDQVAAQLASKAPEEKGACDDEETQDPGPTFRELIHGMRRDANLKVLKLETQDKIELECLIACSLLSLDNSNWTRLGFDIEKVSLQAPGKASAYWTPHMTCF